VIVRQPHDNRAVSPGAWQIIVTVIGIFVAPYLAAKLAVRNLQVERDQARLDELRNVLDETAAQVAICQRAEVAAVTAVLHGVGDDPLHDVDTLDNAIQPLIASIGRVALRLDNDPISDALFEITVQSQAIRQALRTHLAGETTETEQQASTAAEALTNAHAKFLQLGRQVVGPSEQAIADARKRHRLRPPA
jgi:uncharacterized membrane-anchored protein YhcB (DUF1043 family)